jgi:hypothetical protein
MTDKKALKLALDALEQWKCYMPDYWDKWDAEAITALKERLAQEKALQALHSENERLGLYKDAYAQPEQEPVAWEDGPHLVVRSDMRDRLNYKGPWVDMGRAIPDKWIPVLYTTPPQRTWVGSGDLENSNAYQTPPAQPQSKPLTDEMVDRIAHNVEPEDWNSLDYRESWHDGFKAGFREAETEHNIKDKT